MRQTLSNWRQWHSGFLSEPQISQTLEGGLTNHSYIVEADSQRAVVRINHPQANQLGIDRQRELDILRLLQPSGLVPAVLYADQDVLVSQFIQGSTLTADYLDNQAIQQAIADAIEAVQGTRLPNTRVHSYQAHCQLYCDQIPAECLSGPLKADILKIAQQVDRADWQPVLCHHDLVPENIIINNSGLFIIDWEYAALGHPQFDYRRIFADRLPEHQHSLANESMLGLLQAIIDQLWYALRYPELQAGLQEKISKLMATERSK